MSLILQNHYRIKDLHKPGTTKEVDNGYGSQDKTKYLKDVHKEKGYYNSTSSCIIFEKVFNKDLHF